ncbi:MAG: hypothetical protein M1438_09560 [Deltaproteobacteria bacterium]|nr:hypothetical protein [Deltaproteobacteria bacterium]
MNQYYRSPEGLIYQTDDQPFPTFTAEEWTAKLEAKRQEVAAIQALINGLPQPNSQLEELAVNVVLGKPQLEDRLSYLQAELTAMEAV